MQTKVRTALSFIIDNRVLKHIRKITAVEDSQILAIQWDLAPAKLNSFIAMLNGACGAY